MAHHNIFREELATAYPTYGLALWEPDPGGQYDAVEVGDVGFVRRGYFQRLFNVLHPRDHPSHRNPSFVPQDHEQLELVPDHIVKGEIRAGSGQNPNHFYSKNVTLVSHGRGALASRYIRASDPLDFRWLTPDIDPMTIHRLRFLAREASKALYCLFPSQFKVRTLSRLPNSAVGWSRISMPGLPSLEVLA
jgi:hypothetical protein